MPDEYREVVADELAGGLEIGARIAKRPDSNDADIQKIAIVKADSEVETSPLSDTELRAAPVPVTVGNFPADPATQTTLQAILNKLIAAPATELTVLAILAKLIATPATESKQDAGNLKLDTLITHVDGLEGKDFATESTLAALNGKIGIPAADDLLVLLREIRDNTAAEAVSTAELNLTADQVNLNTDAVEAKLDTVAARIGQIGTAGTLADLLELIRTRLIVAPATEAKQNDLNTAIGLLAKLTDIQPVSMAGVSTEAKQNDLLTALGVLGDEADAADVIFLAALADIVTAIEAQNALTAAQLTAEGLAKEAGGVLDDIHTQLAALNLAVDTVETVLGDVRTAVQLMDNAVSGAGFAVTKMPKGSKTFSAVAPDNTADQILAANANRIVAKIQNIGAVDCYLGKDNTVTTANGDLLAAGATLVDEESTDAWWGITAAGSASLRVIEVA